MKIKKILLGMGLVLVVTVLHTAALAEFTGSSDYLTLRARYNKGQLNHEEYVVSCLKSVFEKKSQTVTVKSLSTKANRPDLTLLFKLATDHYDTFSDEAKAYVDALRMRPDLTNNQLYYDNETVPFYLPGTVISYVPDVDDYPNLGGNFTFHYVMNTSRDANDIIHLTTMADRDSVVESFETVYGLEINLMGYPAPLFDNDGNIDVYIANCGVYGIYGYAVSVDVGLGKSQATYMVVDNDFSDFLTNSEEARKATVAHEFHHAVQFGINYNAQPWIMEATSSWIESQVYPTNQDNLNYLNGPSGYFAMTDVPLNDEDQWYNAWIFLEFMKLSYGRVGIVKDIWDELVLTDNGMTAITSVIADEGSTIKNTFTEFALNNYNQVGFYPDASDYDEVSMSNGFGQVLDYSAGESHVIAVSNIYVRHLAAKYYRFLPGIDSTVTNDTLLILVEGTENRTAGVAVSVKQTDNTVVEYPLMLDSQNNGHVYIENFNSDEVYEVVVSLVDSGTSGSSVFDLYGGLDTMPSDIDIVDVQPSNFDIGEEASGCFISHL